MTRPGVYWWSNNWAMAVLWLLNIAQLGLILWMWNDDAYLDNLGFNTLAATMTAVEIVLTVMAILLAIGSFSGFWMIRQAAESAARQEAKKAADQVARETLKEVFDRYGPLGMAYERQFGADGETSRIRTPETPQGKAAGATEIRQRKEDVIDSIKELEGDDGNDDV